MIKKDEKNKIVLVAVLKDKRDLGILMQKRWYRIPADKMPKRKFSYLAFYQPLEFGKAGKCIVYFARVLSKRKVKRITLLPDEPNHPRAHDDYVRLRVGKINKLAHPVKNTIPRRIVFGFTTLTRLKSANNILDLYNIAPTEQILEKELKRAKIKYFSQKYVVCAKRRFRPDFIIICQKGKIALECDNKKAHSNPQQKAKDQTKDSCLQENNWTVIRLPEDEIISDPQRCLAKIQQTIRRLGKTQSSPYS